MDMITKMFVKMHEYQRGQTMTEYALILAAVAVVVFVAYETMGTTIGSVLTNGGQPTLARRVSSTFWREGSGVRAVRRAAD